MGGNISVAEIHRQPVEIYGEEAMNRLSVAKWCSDVKSGRVGQTDKIKHTPLPRKSTRLASSSLG